MGKIDWMNTVYVEGEITQHKSTMLLRFSGGEKLVTKISKRDERKLLLNDVFAEYSLVLQVQ